MKQKIKKYHNSTKSTATDLETLSTKANKAMENGQFRDAVEHFKSLLKLQPLPEYQEGLALAYQKRAHELCSKGMHKEAVVIWDNRRHFCPQAPLDPQHIAMLLQSGRIKDALQLWQRDYGQLDSHEHEILRQRLAVLYLCDAAELEKEIAVDDPIRVHGDLIKSAMAAYCNGDDAKATAVLVNISFRSPYRDLAQILKALQRLPHDRVGASNLIQKIATDSPFAALVQAIKLTFEPESAFGAVLEKTPLPAQNFAACLRGWTTARLNLWRELNKLGALSSRGALEQILRKYRQELGEDWIQYQGLRLLIDGYPRSLERSLILNKRQLSPLQLSLLRAWAQRSERDAVDYLNAWKDVIDILMDPQDPPPGSDNAIRIALIQRYVTDELSSLNRGDEYVYGYDRQNDKFDLQDIGRSWLEDSLKFDPTDLPCHMTLIAHYRNHDMLKDARRLLTYALQNWPDDLNLLGEALDTANASGAFKRASGFAKRMLELDPINRHAQISLFEAHINHARKQIRGKQFTLAQRELAEAGIWAKDESTLYKLDIIKNFLLLAQNEKAGLAAFTTMLQQPNFDLTQCFMLALEVQKFRLTLQDLMTKCHKISQASINTKNFGTFLVVVHAHLNKEHKVTTAALEQFAPAFKLASTLEMSLEDNKLLCEILQKCQFDKLLQHQSKTALCRWPEVPIFELYNFESKYGERAWKASHGELRRLLQAHERAVQMKDIRLAQRIARCLEDADGFELRLASSEDQEDDDDDEYADEDVAASHTENILELRESFIQSMMFMRSLMESVAKLVEQHPKMKKRLEALFDMSDPKKLAIVGDAIRDGVMAGASVDIPGFDNEVINMVIDNMIAAKRAENA